MINKINQAELNKNLKYFLFNFWKFKNHVHMQTRQNYKKTVENTPCHMKNCNIDF